MSKQKLAASSRTLYYELLGVEKNAEDKDLKKAYRKKALQLHPDKQGGDGEPFKKMKYAYDVLTDPKKRKAYDQYGEAGVKMMEGNMSMEVAAQIFFNIGPCERIFLIFLLTLVIGYLLLFPILVSVRWDHPKTMSFAVVFCPVWLCLGFLLCVCLCCIPTPTFPDPEEEDEHLRAEIEEEQQKQISDIWKLRWGSIAIISVLSTLLLLLVLRLDRELKCSYFLVIWPWILLELGLFGYKWFMAENVFLMTHKPEWNNNKGGKAQTPEGVRQQKWQTKDWNLFVASFTFPHLFYIVFACILALKLDHTYEMSWWEVFTPLWAEWVFSTVLIFAGCGKIKSQEELAGMTMEERAHEETCGTIMCKVILRCMWLGCIVLLCLKLSHPSSFPAWVMFLPVFVLAGCFCCCLSCFLCCMNSESMVDEDDEEAAGWHADAGNAPTYGTVK